LNCSPSVRRWRLLPGTLGPCKAWPSGHRLRRQGLDKVQRPGTRSTVRSTPRRGWIAHFHPLVFQKRHLDYAGNPLPGHGEGITFFIGPKATKFSTTLKIPTTLVEQVGDGKARLFVWGRAEYNDVFENTPPHHTEFCNEVVITNISHEDNKVQASMQFSL